MKEIYDLILKEKGKDIPNRDYIHFLQQMTDKPEKEYFVQEVKRQNIIDQLYIDNIIELDDFFKYSGKIEEIKPLKEDWINEYRMK